MIDAHPNRDYANKQTTNLHKHGEVSRFCEAGVRVGAFV